MDILKIKTGFTKNIISWLIKTQVKKNLNIDVDPKIGDLNVSIEDGGKVSVHLELELDLETDTKTVGDLVKRFM